MMNQPTFKEHFKAIVSVCPMNTFWMIAGLVVGISHVIYVSINSPSSSMAEHFGLPGIWFSAWVVAFVSALYTSTHEPQIDEVAKQLAKRRLQNQYGQKY